MQKLVKELVIRVVVVENLVSDELIRCSSDHTKRDHQRCLSAIL